MKTNIFFILIIITITTTTTVDSLFDTDYITEIDLKINLKLKINVSVWIKYQKETDRITAAIYHEDTPYDKHYYKIPVMQLSERRWIRVDFQRGTIDNNNTFSISVQGISDVWHPEKEDHPSNFVDFWVYGDVDLYYKNTSHINNTPVVMTVVIFTVLILFFVGSLFLFFLHEK